MPLLVKILCYLISGLLTLYGLFGLTPEFDDISKNPKFNNILHALLVVIWRISFTVSGVALFFLARYYSELSDTQMGILLVVTFNLIIIGIIVAIVTFVVYCFACLWFAFDLFLVDLLWPLIFEPIWEKIGGIADKIGLTPKLKKCYAGVQNLTKRLFYFLFRNL